MSVSRPYFLLKYSNVWSVISISLQNTIYHTIVFQLHLQRWILQQVKHPFLRISHVSGFSILNLKDLILPNSRALSNSSTKFIYCVYRLPNYHSFNKLFDFLFEIELNRTTLQLRLLYLMILFCTKRRPRSTTTYLKGNATRLFAVSLDLNEPHNPRTIFLYFWHQLRYH